MVLSIAIVILYVTMVTSNKHILYRKRSYLQTFIFMIQLHRYLVTSKVFSNKSKYYVLGMVTTKLNNKVCSHSLQIFAEPSSLAMIVHQQKGYQLTVNMDNQRLWLLEFLFFNAPFWSRRHRFLTTYYLLGPLSLRSINFNPRVVKQSYVQWSLWCHFLSIVEFQTLFHVTMDVITYPCYS